MSESIIKAEHLKRVFVTGKSSFAAVDDVSFELKKGECLGIVGESGSGKSTIARLLTGLLPCSGGRIFFSLPETKENHGLPGKKQEERRIEITGAGTKELRQVYRHMQMIFQTPAESFDPRRTLGDGIGESLKNMGIKGAERKKRVEHLLELCGLSGEFANRYPHQASGGQCQRAAIARALAPDPELLICDEATSALDVTVQKQVMELLTRLKKERNLSVIFISHDLALVQMFCDRVLVMEQGKIVEAGPVEQVIGCPKEAYTRKLVESVL